MQVDAKKEEQSNAQKTENKQAPVNAPATVQTAEPTKVQNVESRQEPPHEFKDPRKVPPKEDLKIEDKLEFATMSPKSAGQQKKTIKGNHRGNDLCAEVTVLLICI